MPDIALGYGSKWHLLRYLGYHREEMNRAIEGATGTRVVRWLDFVFEPERVLLDGEWRGLDFLPADSPVKQAWHRAWPQQGNVPNWDAVGWVQDGPSIGLLLVEAKAHTGELRSACRGRRRSSVEAIQGVLDEAKMAFGVPGDTDWLKPYYQYCNRLAVLHFLVAHGIPTHLVFVYFMGDGNPHADCPADEAGWRPALAEMRAHVGLSESCELRRRVHSLFLPVCRRKASQLDG
jgi:hypothetical protein